MIKYLPKQNKIQPQFWVIDATAQLFRGYYGNAARQNSQGEFVHAVLGMAANIREIINQHKPQYLALAFDAAQYTFRNEIYPEYKANRGDPPDDLKGQFELAFEFAKVASLPYFFKKGYEADDVISTLSKFAGQNQVETVIVSNDKDLFQLVRDSSAKVKSVKIFDVAKQSFLDEAFVEQKIGVRASQAVDYFALTGDSIDNIKGVENVGAKTAQQLLNHFQNLDDIFAHSEQILNLNIRNKEKVLQGIENSRSQKEILKTLITLHHEVELGISQNSFLPTVQWPLIDEKKITEFFTRLDAKARAKSFIELNHFYADNNPGKNKT